MGENSVERLAIDCQHLAEFRVTQLRRSLPICSRAKQLDLQDFYTPLEQAVNFVLAGTEYA